jgi:uncharacterized membrane protein YgcG
VNTAWWVAGLLCIATMLALVAVSSAAPRALTKKQARSAAAKVVRVTASRTAASTAKVTRCDRRAPRHFNCSAYYAYLRSPGSPICASKITVKLSKQKRRTRASQYGVRCGRSGTSTPGTGGGSTPGAGGGSTPGAGGGSGLLPEIVPGATPSTSDVPIVCSDGTIVLLEDTCARHGGVLIGIPPLSL